MAGSVGVCTGVRVGVVVVSLLIVLVSEAVSVREDGDMLRLSSERIKGSR